MLAGGGENPLCLQAFWGAALLETEAAWHSWAFFGSQRLVIGPVLVFPLLTPPCCAPWPAPLSIILSLVCPVSLLGCYLCASPLPILTPMPPSFPIWADVTFLLVFCLASTGWCHPIGSVCSRLYCPGPSSCRFPLLVRFHGCILLLIPYCLGLFILVPHPSLTYALMLPRGVVMVSPCPV